MRIGSGTCWSCPVPNRPFLLRPKAYRCPFRVTTRLWWAAAATMTALARMCRCANANSTTRQGRLLALASETPRAQWWARPNVNTSHACCRCCCSCCSCVNVQSIMSKTGFISPCCMACDKSANSSSGSSKNVSKEELLWFCCCRCCWWWWCSLPCFVEDAITISCGLGSDSRHAFKSGFESRPSKAMGVNRSASMAGSCTKTSMGRCVSRGSGPRKNNKMAVRLASKTAQCKGVYPDSISGVAMNCWYKAGSSWNARSMSALDRPNSGFDDEPREWRIVLPLTSLKWSSSCINSLALQLLLLLLTWLLPLLLLLLLPEWDDCSTSLPHEVERWRLVKEDIVARSVARVYCCCCCCCCCCCEYYWCWCCCCVLTIIGKSARQYCIWIVWKESVVSRRIWSRITHQQGDDKKKKAFSDCIRISGHNN